MSITDFFLFIETNSTAHFAFVLSFALLWFLYKNLYQSGLFKIHKYLQSIVHRIYYQSAGIYSNAVV